jgi:Cys-rich repeat protein
VLLGPPLGPPRPRLLLVLLSALLGLAAGCADDGSVVVVAGIPPEAATLETAIAVEGQPAQDSPALDLAPYGGKAELSLAVRCPGDRSGALHVAARVLGPDPERCVLAFGTNPAGDSTASPLVKVTLAPLAAPDCSGKLPRLVRATPDSATAGTQVLLAGWGLQPGAQTFLYEGAPTRAPVEATFLSPGEIAARMPELAVGAQRPITVRVVNPDGGEDTRLDVLSYFSSTGDRTCCMSAACTSCSEACLFYLQSDPNHCGNCATACPKDRATCVSGKCQCGAAAPCANGVCLNGACVQCARNSDCAAGQFCENNACRACNDNRHCGTTCVDCTGMRETPVCRDDGTLVCVQCNRDGDCLDPEMPRCDTSTRRCVQCTGFEHCGMGQYCGRSNYCTACNLPNLCGPTCSSCSNPTPACKFDGSGCAECSTASYCALSPKGKRCINYSCGCQLNSDCPTGKTCDTMAKVCSP